jgi:hypothetical protein
MDGAFWLFAFLLWAMMAGLGAWVATQKERDPAEGAILGFVFGPLGVLIEALLPAGKAKAVARPGSSYDRVGLDLAGAEDGRALAFLGAMEPPGRPKPRDQVSEWLQAVATADPEPEPQPVVPARVPENHWRDGDVVVWICGCGAQYRVHIGYAGREATCPQCRARVVIPGGGS